MSVQADPNRPPLLLLHGALGSIETLSPLAERLKANRLIFSLNFSGHGGTPFEGPFTVPRFTDEVMDMLDRVQVDQVDVFGYSLGGYVALHLALQHPTRVRKVYTLATQFDWTPESAAREVQQLDPQQIEAKVPHFAEQLRQRHHPQSWRQNLRYSADLMRRLGAGEALNGEHFQRISQPVVIARGEQDGMLEAEESQRIAELLPQGRFHSLPDCPHPLEQVPIEPLATDLEAFLEE